MDYGTSCHSSLIRVLLFVIFSISQGSGVTHLRCGGENDNSLVGNFLADSNSERIFLNWSTFELDALLHCSEDTTPLEFWKSQSSKFVKLSDIARSVYGIPATQNRSERSFSAAGHVVTDLRTNIDPDHVDELLLLRSYYRQTHDNGDTADNSDED